MLKEDCLSSQVYKKVYLKKHWSALVFYKRYTKNYHNSGRVKVSRFVALIP